MGLMDQTLPTVVGMGVVSRTTEVALGRGKGPTGGTVRRKKVASKRKVIKKRAAKRPARRTTARKAVKRRARRGSGWEVPIDKVKTLL